MYLPSAAVAVDLARGGTVSAGFQGLASSWLSARPVMVRDQPPRCMGAAPCLFIKHGHGDDCGDRDDRRRSVRDAVAIGLPRQGACAVDALLLVPRPDARALNLVNLADGVEGFVKRRLDCARGTRVTS